MAFPDRIEQTMEVAHPLGQVSAAQTTAKGLGTWFGGEATIDLRLGGLAGAGGATGTRSRCAWNGSRSRPCWDGPLAALQNHLDGACLRAQHHRTSRNRRTSWTHQ
jgi:hypothetical protein